MNRSLAVEHAVKHAKTSVQPISRWVGPSALPPGPGELEPMPPPRSPDDVFAECADQAQLMKIAVDYLSRLDTENEAAQIERPETEVISAQNEVIDHLEPLPLSEDGYIAVEAELYNAADAASEGEFSVPPPPREHEDTDSEEII